MKKFLSILMAALMLVGLAAVAASAEDIAALEFEQVEIVEQADINTIIGYGIAVTALEAKAVATLPSEYWDRYNALTKEQKAALNEAADKAAKGNMDKADAETKKTDADRFDRAFAFYKKGLADRYSSIQFQLTFKMPAELWAELGASSFLMTIMLVLSWICRYIFFGWAGWMM